MGQIHPTAQVDAAAELDASVSVGAYSLVGPRVRAAAGVSIGPHCVVEGRTTIGAHTRIFQFCSIGAVPQDMKYAGEPTELVIGERNTIREFCTFNIGTAQDGGVTRIGSDNWIMAYVHLAHDVQLGDHAVLANGATLAGHVHIGDWATIGGLTAIHQFVKVGAQAMVGFQSHVAQDVPPFMTVDGHPLAARAVNVVGLKRRGFTPDRIATIREMHRLLYRSSLTLNQAIEGISALGGEDVFSVGDKALMVRFLSAATRGIVR